MNCRMSPPMSTERPSMIPLVVEPRDAAWGVASDPFSTSGLRILPLEVNGDDPSLLGRVYQAAINADPVALRGLLYTLPTLRQLSKNDAGAAFNAEVDTAVGQGWCVFTRDYRAGTLEIQRVEDLGIHPTNAAAFQTVYDAALSGSPLHLAAIRMTLPETL